jgi:hypothetical protein
VLAPYSVSDVERPASPGRGQLSAAFLDRADDVLRQRYLFDEHVMPHANTFASGLKELNCASGQANQTTLGNRPAVSAPPAATRVADLSGHNIWPEVPDRCTVVVAEPFSQSGKSFGCTPPNLMSICSRRTF